MWGGECVRLAFEGYWEDVVGNGLVECVDGGDEVGKRVGEVG